MNTQFFNKLSDFWLIVNPYVYISKNDEQFLIVNTLNGDTIQKKNKKIVDSIFKEVVFRKNRYVIKLSKNALSNEELKLIFEMRSKFMADVIECEGEKPKPFQIFPKPELMLIRDEMVFKVSSNRLLKRDVVNGYIETVSIYINSACNQKCNSCCSAYNQFLTCSKGNSSENIDFLSFKGLISQFNGTSLKKINIIGANIFLHSEYESIIEYLDKIPVEQSFFINYQNILNDHEKFRKLYDKRKVSILVNSQININAFSELLSLLGSKKNNVTFRFIIETSNEFEQYKRFANEHNLENIEVNYYFNKHNRKFIKENLLIKKNSFKNLKNLQQKIIVNQLLNINDFRKLTILNDGSVYANTNHEKLGNFKKDRIMDLVVNEINDGHSWYNIREKVVPCKDCLHKALCPPIRNYEYVLDCHNICDVRA